MIKQTKDILMWIEDHELESHEELQDFISENCDGGYHWDYPKDEKDHCLESCREDGVEFEDRFVPIKFDGEIRFYEYYEVEVDC